MIRPYERAASFVSNSMVSWAECPVTRTRLRRDLRPETITTQACGKRRARAKNRTQASFACPSTGGARTSRHISPEEVL